ncbi:MAG: type I 3-dehydroquinate dehydratase [Chitinispirillales bacterium]|jgi:3-dehydroquinate dehydratase-1|nr:type I 3-dehydroquinate dehydratase [Chitinispirillales bacterium]
MAAIKIKNITLGTVPRVVGIIDQPMPIARLQKFAAGGIDIFEIRADLFNKPIDKVVAYINMIKGVIRSPLIGTIRETDYNRANRIDWLISLSRHVDIIDVELGIPEWRDVVKGIAGSSTIIMVSEHDFNSTPDMPGLEDIVKRSIAQGAGIVKIAAMARTASDVTRLMRFTEECGVPIVTMAMGDVGKISRVVAPLFGSLFVYGYLRKPIVPGQLSALAVAKALKLYY